MARSVVETRTPSANVFLLRNILEVQRANAPVNLAKMVKHILDRANDPVVEPAVC